MKRVSIGGLACDALGREARYQEPGLLITGKICEVTHELDFKKKSRTKVRFDVKGSYLSVTRPDSTEIEIEEIVEEES
jgi:hypothetical protein